jgi:hypothetical protein
MDVPVPLGSRNILGLRDQLLIATAHNDWTASVLEFTHSFTKKLFTNWLYWLSKLPPISSSWRQASWDSRPEMFFFQRNPCGHSLYVTSSLMRRWVCLSWTCLAFVKCTYRTSSILLKILPFYYVYIILCQSTFYKADYAYLTYFMIQRQLSHLNGRKLDQRQVRASFIFH